MNNPSSPTYDKEQQLASDWGYSSPEDLMEDFITDSVCPGICTNENCSYSIEVEPDCSSGYCEECDTQSVSSMMILMGVI